MTKRISTGGKPDVCRRAVCEKTHSVLRCPLYQSTVTVSQSVSERSAQACQRRWRLPFVGVGPRVPGG